MTHGPYHLLSMGALLLASYLVSQLMVRTRLISLQNHRKLWNTILLLFFSSTAILGILLVVKVNYKLNISWVEEAMQWHVDSGIGFALVAIFHLLWHIRYYFRRSAQTQENTSIDSSFIKPGFNQFQQRSFFMMLGYISIMAQLVLLREFIKNFHGNELVIGIFLAVWMILTALGARIGSGYVVPMNPRRISFLLVTMSGLPILVYLLLILVNRFLFLPGLQPGLLDTVISVLILTSLFTGLSGFLFGVVSRSVKNSINKASPYMLDAIGSVAGGILCSMLFMHLLDNFQLLAFLFMTTSVSVIIIYRFPVRRGPRWILIMAVTLLFVLSLIPGLQNELQGLRYRNEEILETRDTPIGNLTFTLANEQVTGYMDGTPVITSSDLMKAEESVHFPSLQLSNPASFLLLGGGWSGQITEVAKYKPGTIDYCEADPWIYYMGKNHFYENIDPSLHFIPKDGRTWLMRSGEAMYDVIISNTGDPLTIGWNRYFTLEFYRLVRQHLSPDGVFCMQLTTADQYVNEEGLRILSINDHTLKEVFPNVLIVPGSSTYFLASERPLSLDFPSLLSQQQILTTYVHPDYLDADQILFDSEQLTSRIKLQERRINSDLWPRLFFASLMGNESKTGRASMEVAGIISALLFLILLFRYTPLHRAMYITGFTGAGIQIILIMVVQSFYGFAYMVAPIMITLFMSGIVGGMIICKRVWRKSSLTGITGLVMIMALMSLTGLLLPVIGGMFDSRWSGPLILGLLNFIPGMVVGSVYSLGIGIKKENPPGILGELYSADLTGAALGTFIPVIFLLPLIGVINSYILFFGINLATGFSLIAGGLKIRGDG